MNLLMQVLVPCIHNFLCTWNGVPLPQPKCYSFTITNLQKSPPLPEYIINLAILPMLLHI